MMWQMWTAFGIMLGYISGVVFRSVLDGDSASCSAVQARSVLLNIRCVSGRHLTLSNVSELTLP